MPRAEPFAARSDWLICTRGRRSAGRGLGNLTRRDWSLPTRRRLRGRTKNGKSLKKTKLQNNRLIFNLYEITLLCVRVCVRGAQSLCADVSTLRESVKITLQSSTPFQQVVDHSTTHRGEQLM